MLNKFIILMIDLVLLIEITNIGLFMINFFLIFNSENK